METVRHDLIHRCLNRKTIKFGDNRNEVAFRYDPLQAAIGIANNQGSNPELDKLLGDFLKGRFRRDAFDPAARSNGQESADFHSGCFPQRPRG